TSRSSLCVTSKCQFYLRQPILVLCIGYHDIDPIRVPLLHFRYETNQRVAERAFWGIEFKHRRLFPTRQSRSESSLLRLPLRFRCQRTSLSGRGSQLDGIQALLRPRGR
ncbi:unnamed protein product, partial [Linum tenue]